MDIVCYVYTKYAIPARITKHVLLCVQYLKKNSIYVLYIIIGKLIQKKVSTIDYFVASVVYA